MIVSHHRIRMAIPALVLLALACQDAPRLAPPPPRAEGAWVDTTTPMDPSHLDVPVRYDLAPALAWLEATVPRTLGAIDQRIAVPDNDRVHFAFELRRGPFHVEFEGRTASIVAVLDYQGRGWYNPPVLPEVSASCGTEGPRPRARLILRTNIVLGDDWMLHPRSRAIAQRYTDTERDQCEVTALHLDVTGKVLAAAEEALRKELVKLDREMRAYPLRTEAEKIWGFLLRPLRLTDSLWLVIDPSEIRIGGLAMSGDTLVTMVGLSATPKIVGGARPADGLRPLPAVTEGAEGSDALNILSEGRLPYDVASTILSRELKGDELKVGRRTLYIEALEVRPVGDGRAAVGLTVSGPVSGTLYAVGHPQFDSATGRLTMPDLEYDLGTRQQLVGALAWLAEDAITDFLRTNVRINLTSTLEGARQLVERELNRDLAPGVRLHTTIASAKATGLRAAPDALLAQAIVTGRGELVVNLEPPETQAGQGVRGSVDPQINPPADPPTR
jgi:uncharacterized protein DUF4403